MHIHPSISPYCMRIPFQTDAKPIELCVMRNNLNGGVRTAQMHFVAIVAVVVVVAGHIPMQRSSDPIIRVRLSVHTHIHAFIAYILYCYALPET